MVSHPWELERVDSKNFASPLNKTLELGKDGDVDVFMEEIEQLKLESDGPYKDNMHAEVINDERFDDNLPSRGVVDAKIWQDSREMMDEHEELLVIAPRPLSISTTVIFYGHTIIKSTLIIFEFHIF
jgi:hypothetical protein